MRVPQDHPLALTLDVAYGSKELSSLASLGRRKDRYAQEALIEAVLSPSSARIATTAIGALKNGAQPLAQATLQTALSLLWPSARLAAVGALSSQTCQQQACAAQLVRLLLQDDSRLVRREALRRLASLPDERRWTILQAADDPHWRVRCELIERVAPWGWDPDQRRRIEQSLLQPSQQPFVEGVLRYLQLRWEGHDAQFEVQDKLKQYSQFQSSPQSHHRLEIWDWDPAVLVRRMKQLDEAGCREIVDFAPAFFGHEDDRVVRCAQIILSRYGTTDHLIETLSWLAEPRWPAASRAAQWFDKLNLDHREAAARRILQTSEGSSRVLSWAIGEAGVAFPPQEEAERLQSLYERAIDLQSEVRIALARLAARWKDDPNTFSHLLLWLEDRDPAVQTAALESLAAVGAAAPASRLQALFGSPFAEVRRAAMEMAACSEGILNKWSDRLLHDADFRVRRRLAEIFVAEPTTAALPLLTELQSDEHPYVRAAALTNDRAEKLMQTPTEETCWHVLRRAAHITRTPIWKIEPERRRKTVHTPPAISPVSIKTRQSPQLRPLGPAGVMVSPLGLSGHYGLPPEGFHKAVEAGVNLLFWEPNYDTLTTFCRRLAPAQRNTLHFITGTFEADPKRIRSDAERALRRLDLEQIRFFMLFWVRSWRRITPDVMQCLETLQQEGKISAFGLSTHSRPLAVEAIERGWNPVMVRHSAAHRGAEQAVFPAAIEHGVGLISFNNTNYGRLLKKSDREPWPFSAADCYRFSLAQPAVRVCMTAPATMEQWTENVSVLHSPEIAADHFAAIVEHGKRVYLDDRMFARLVRGV